MLIEVQTDNIEDLIKHVSHDVYSRYCGNIPVGYAVGFKDGCRYNLIPENLLVVPTSGLT